MKTLIALGLASLSSLSLAGGAVDIALTLDSVRLEHETTLSGTGMMLTAGVLYDQAEKEPEKGDQGVLGVLGFHAIDPRPGPSPFIAGLGGRAYAFDTDAAGAAVALGIGGFVRIQPDQLHGVGLEAYAHFAPQVLSWAGAEAVTELVARVNYKVLPQARVFLGYQYIAANYEQTDDVELAHGVNLGFRVIY